MTNEPLKRLAPAVLLLLGLAQMAGDVLGLDTLKGTAAATLLSPAPKVFSAVKGLETYSTRFYIECRDDGGAWRSFEMTPDRCRRLRGPYNRRNVYGAALAYGPVLQSDERVRPMLEAVLRYALAGDAPLLTELGLEGERGASQIRIRYEPLPGTELNDDLPRVVEVPTR